MRSRRTPNSCRNVDALLHVTGSVYISNALQHNATNILRSQGGLNDTSRLVKKNLQAAIAVAQQPGFFEYYKVSEEVKKIEKMDELKKLTKKIKRFQKEIDQVNSEIGEEAKRRRCCRIRIICRF